MAASIPVLRALFSEMKTSAQQYYGDAKRSRTTTSTHNAIVTADRTLGKLTSQQSDEELFVQEIPADGKILQTSEVILEYHDRNDPRGQAYEMRGIPKAV